MEMNKEVVLLVVAGLLQLILAVLMVLWLSQYIYTISMGYWAYFTFVLMILIFSSIAYGKSSKPIAVLYVLVTIFSFGTFIACCAILAVRNTRGLGFEVKLIFSLVTAVLSALFANLLRKDTSTAVEEKALEAKGATDLEAGERTYLDKGCSCCFTFCSVFLVAQIIAAASHTMIHASEIAEFYPGDEALTEVNGHLLFARCSGTGSPPVVFFHGLNGNSLDFTWVQREVSKVTKTCSFDRPGYGQSREFGKGDRTSAQHAIEAEALLQDNGITGDFIAVGHSYAGFNMRTYNRDYPGRMQGIVFVDTVNPSPNYTEACDPNEEYNYGLLFNVGVFIADAGILRILDAVGLIEALGYPLRNLPEDVQREYFANLQSYFAKTALDEYRVWGKSCSGLRNLSPAEQQLPFPISVIAAEKGIFLDDLRGAEEQADLSVNSTYILVPDAGHSGVLFQPEFANITTQEVLKLIDLYNNP